MRSIILLPLCLLACGDNGDKPTRPDAAPRPDMMPDTPTVVPCTFTEAADATNDDLFGSGTAEATSINFGASNVMICGQINNGHFNATEMNVDVDSYTFTVPAQTRGILYLTAPGGENLDSLLIEIYGMTTATSETGEFNFNFAATSANLPPGDYQITVSGYDGADIGAAINYKLQLELDSPTRCAHATGTPMYTETIDTATASGNDVIEVRYGAGPARQLTASVLDMPEPTGISVVAGNSYLIRGTNIDPPNPNPASWADSFQDRDTYQIAMGANTNVLSVRLNWPGTTGDFDMFIFDQNGIIERANGWYNATMEDEYVTLAVVPGMSYWIWAGLDDPSTGQPITYDVTVCGSTFTPPTP